MKRITASASPDTLTVAEEILYGLARPVNFRLYVDLTQQTNQASKELLGTCMDIFTGLVQRACAMQRQNVPRLPRDTTAQLTRMTFEKDIKIFSDVMRADPRYREFIPALNAISDLAFRKDISDLKEMAYDPEKHTKDLLLKNSRAHAKMAQKLVEEGKLTEEEVLKQHHYDDMADNYLIKVNQVLAKKH